MESRAKLLGHAVHPILIVFPLGLLAMSVIFDVVFMTTRSPTLASVSFWNIAAGIIGGLLAAVFGLWDWAAIPDGTRAKRVGLVHGVGNVVVVAVFALSWWLRRDDPAHLPGPLTMTLEVIGLVLAAVTGWLGGELVERLGVGVDRGAHLDAPSSLSGEPASSFVQDRGRS
jgi:uncharacterized membrane protein